MRHTAVVLAALALLCTAACSHHSLPTSEDNEIAEINAAQSVAHDFITTSDNTTPSELAGVPEPESEIGQRIAQLSGEGYVRVRTLDEDYDELLRQIDDEMPRGQAKKNAKAKLAADYTQKRAELSTVCVPILRSLIADLEDAVDALSLTERATIALHVRAHGHLSTDNTSRAIEAALWHILAITLAPKDRLGFAMAHDDTGNFEWLLWPQAVSSVALVDIATAGHISAAELSALLRDRTVLADMDATTLAAIVHSLCTTSEGATLITAVLRENLGSHARTIAPVVAKHAAGPATSSAPHNDALFDAAISVLARLDSHAWLPSVWRTLIDADDGEDKNASTESSMASATTRLASLMRHAPAALANAALGGDLTVPRGTYSVATRLARSPAHFSLQTHVALIALIMTPGTLPVHTLQHAMVFGDYRGEDDLKLVSSGGGSPLGMPLSGSVTSDASLSSTDSNAHARLRSTVIGEVLTDTNRITAAMVLSAAEVIIGALRALANESTLHRPIHVPRPFFDAVFAAAHHARTAIQSAPASASPTTAVHVIVRSPWRNTARMLFERLAIVSDLDRMTPTRLDRSEDEDDGAFAKWQDGIGRVFDFEPSSYDDALRHVVRGPYDGRQDGGSSDNEELASSVIGSIVAGLVPQAQHQSGRKSRREHKKRSFAKRGRRRETSHAPDDSSLGVSLPAQHSVDETNAVLDSAAKGRFPLTDAMEQLSITRRVCSGDEAGLLLHAQSTEIEMAATVEHPPLFVQHYDTLLEALSTRMDCVFRILTPQNSTFFSAMRHSLRLRPVSERIRVIANPLSHPVSVVASSSGDLVSAAQLGMTLPQTLTAESISGVVVIPARMADLRDAAQTLQALEMHALLHYGVDPSVFRAAAASVLGMDTEAVARLRDVAKVALIFERVLLRPVVVCVLAHRPSPF